MSHNVFLCCECLIQFYLFFRVKSVVSTEEANNKNELPKGKGRSSVCLRNRSKKTTRTGNCHFSSEESDSSNSESSELEPVKLSKRHSKALNTDDSDYSQSKVKAEDSDSSGLLEDVSVRKRSCRKSQFGCRNTTTESSSESEQTDVKKTTTRRLTKSHGRKRARIRKKSESDETTDNKESDSKAASVRISLSDSDTSGVEQKDRKRIRKLYTQSTISMTTKTAEAQERERRRRIAEKQKLVSCISMKLLRSSTFLNTTVSSWRMRSSLCSY